MTLHGVDVSSYQPDWRPSVGDGFCFIKASEGVSYRNPYRAQQEAAARAAGLQVGWYHYLRKGSIAEQVAYFLGTSGIREGDLFACDWEYAGLTTSDKDSFIQLCQQSRPHNLTGLYCNQYWWLSVDRSSYCGAFLWMARYGSSPGVQHPVKFWQYTDRPIDQNYGYFASLSELKSWAGTTPPPAPIPAPAPDPAPAPAPIERELLDVSTFTTHDRSKDQRFNPKDDKIIRIDDRDNVSLGFGPGRYQITMRFAIDGLKPGDDFRVTFYTVDTDHNGKQVGKPHDYPVVGLNGSAGSSWPQVTFDRDIPAPKPGLTRRLRVRGGYSGSKPITVTAVNSTVREASL